MIPGEGRRELGMRGRGGACAAQGGLTMTGGLAGNYLMGPTTNSLPSFIRTREWIT
jgi:hypothetical protein